MISLKDYDFKKAASSALKETDAEIAFYRASSTVMEDKASPFLQMTTILVLRLSRQMTLSQRWWEFTYLE